MNYLFTLYFFLIYNLVFINAQVGAIKELPLIPKPKSEQIVGGYFEASSLKQIIIPSKAENALKIGRGIQNLLGLPELPVKKVKGTIVQKSKSITLSLISIPDKPEYYKMHITKNGIWIQASQDRGWFYALQTLNQIVQLNENTKRDANLLPYCIIEDEPRFPYRGMHLDVSRHFFPVSFVKNYLDLMARFKYNYFHWHLTDDQGWRIEIKRFPNLTDVGAYRKGTLIGKPGDRPQKFDTSRYGGFYTQEQVKEIIQYANERFITVIPEIEMPGHSAAALAAYPEYSCKGLPSSVANSWGVFDSGIYCTKDTSLWFLKEILNEVCDLFPGKYIHIGGDECLKENWKACEQCQSVKRRNNLKSEEELQSYFIRQIEKFINSKGKQIIGWDEILEGGLAPNATVMSWRGVEGGIAAAKQKHPVIMCPGSHCYFDHYQSMQSSEPLAIGGYTSLKKTYSFQVIPDSLKPGDKNYILGAQGNVWTEYMPTEDQVLYMSYPRALALAEVNWSAETTKNYSSFLNRLQFHVPWFKSKNMTITQGVLDIDYTTIPSQNGVVLIFQKPPIEGKILVESERGGDKVAEYLKQDSFVLNKDIQFKAWYQLTNKSLGKPLLIDFKNHMACGKTIKLTETPALKYFQGGTQCLVNGIEAPHKRYGGPEWVGLEGQDFTALIDIDKIDSLKSVKIQFYHDPTAWIYRPKDLEISTSLDGVHFSTPVFYQINETESKHIQPFIPLEHVFARYIQIKVRNHGMIEGNQNGAGHKAWLFVGEIEIR
ncbi:MAG: beta-N-acetylhexosaminidase [Saprospiraceae bacterium]|jgi:hexosaminidase|nr:beta-N-acetylhexosaminidase [Saprospiraceae bacterium]